MPMVGRDTSLPTLVEVLEDLKQTLREMCKRYGIEDLSALKYRTVAIGTAEIRKKGRVYKRAQLKAFTDRSKTIASWKEEEAPKDLLKLVNHYRACKHLSRACDYLHAIKPFKKL